MNKKNRPTFIVFNNFNAHILLFICVHKMIFIRCYSTPWNMLQLAIKLVVIILYRRHNIMPTVHKEYIF